MRVCRFALLKEYTGPLFGIPKFCAPSVLVDLEEVMLR